MPWTARFSFDRPQSNSVTAYGSRLAKLASTWIGVASLADPGFLIEVEATAVLD